MKIKFIGSGTFISKGVRFEQNTEVEVADEFGAYIVKTFKAVFVVVPEAKIEVTPVEEEVKVPTRKSRTKKAVPSEE